VVQDYLFREGFVMFFGKKGLAVAAAILLLLGAAAGWSAEQGRDQLRDGTGDGTPDMERLQDGSCVTEEALVSQAAPKGDADRLRDGTGDGVPDRDKARDMDQDQLQDGSCLA
jgi:hypothetical protein